MMVQKSRPSNEAHILFGEAEPNGLAVVSEAQSVGHMDLIIAPLGTGISECKPKTTAFTTHYFQAYATLTWLHNINKHVCTEEVKQSDPPGTEC